MRASLLLCLGCALAACSGALHDDLSAATLPVPAKKHAEIGASCGLNGRQGIETEVLHRVNALRASGAICGAAIYAAAAPLTWNKQLLQAARDHADDMAQHNYFSHNRRDGSTPVQRIRAAGYCMKQGWISASPGATERYFCLQQVRVCVRWRTENAMSFFL